MTAPNAPLYHHCCGCDRPLVADPAWCVSCEATMPAYLETSARPYAVFDGAALSLGEVLAMHELNKGFNPPAIVNGCVVDDERRAA